MSQKFRIRGVVTVVLVVAMVGAASPAAMADDAPDVAKSIVMAKTGSSGRDVVGSEVKRHGVTVSPAKTQDGRTLRTLVQDTANSVAALAVLEEGQSSAVFHGMLPAGSKITPTDGGDYQVLTPDGTRLTIKAPWALDAAGKSLPTSYTFAAGQITQNVDTTRASFPVVADPVVRLEFGGGFANFNRDETLMLAGVVGAANKGLRACAIISAHFGAPNQDVCRNPTAPTAMALSIDAAARTAGQCLHVSLVFIATPIRYLSSRALPCGTMPL